MTNNEPVAGPWFPHPLIVGDGKCRGDRVEHVQDLFRLLCRAREYLIEADRQLRHVDEEEQAERDAWYAEMDANDEWTAETAEAHADCVIDIIAFFDEHSALTADVEGKRFLVDGEWLKFNSAPELKRLREGALKIQARIATQSIRN